MNKFYQYDYEGKNHMVMVIDDFNGAYLEGMYKTLTLFFYQKISIYLIGLGVCHNLY